jgi:four helix bundle protein
MDLVELTYVLSRGFPREELFGLTSQMRRAAVSVASNIAEGQARGSNADFVRFLRMSCGSLAELETQCFIAGRLTYLTDEQVVDLQTVAGEVGRLLNGLIRSKQSS